MEAQNEQHREDVDRLVLLLSSRPREGWEGIFEAASKREVERLFALGADNGIGDDD